MRTNCVRSENRRGQPRTTASAPPASRGADVWAGSMSSTASSRRSPARWHRRNRWHRVSPWRRTLPILDQFDPAVSLRAILPVVAKVPLVPLARSEISRCSHMGARASTLSAVGQPCTRHTRILRVERGGPQLAERDTTNSLQITTAAPGCLLYLRPDTSL